MRERQRKRSKTGRLPDTAQQGLGLEVQEAAGPRTEPEGRVRFEEGERRGLWVGDMPLARYLEEAQLGWVVRMVDFLAKEVDFGGFEAAYKPGGRPPIHPRVLVGLFLYGMLLRQWSLRELEGLAKRDVGAWWVCAGLTPDHSTLGRFALQHAALLTEDFFLSVAQAAVRRLGLTVGTVAGDGTVVEAASAMASTLKRAALEAAQQQAQEGAKAAPEDEQARARVQVLAQAEAVLSEREGVRERVGKPVEGVRVSPHEPQAVVQPRKDGAVRPAYKPSVLVHEAGLIVGQALHPSSETLAVASLLVQHGQLMGALPKASLFDAGFLSHQVLAMAVEVELDVLIPSGKAKGEEDFERRGKKGLFAKTHFHYEAQGDFYLCPAGARLTPCGPQRDGAGRFYREYRTAACKGCPLRQQCTSASRGRKLKRYEGDELKEAMALVLSQPTARAAYRRRAPIVEPVFAELKHRQGLTRFHRKGRAKVALEFALHCTAYNLKRVVGRPLVVVRLVFVGRLPGHPWRLLWAGLLLYAG